VEYSERQPRAQLRPFVEAFWLLRGAGDGALNPVLPDGRSELILHRGTPFDRVPAGGEPSRQASRLFAGQMRSPAFLSATSSAEVIGVRFRPCGAAIFIAAPPGELVDQIVDVDLMGERWLVELMHRAHDAVSADEAIGVLEEGLVQRLIDPPAGFFAASTAVDRLIARRGDASIERIAHEAGLGRRQLERAFHDHVGLPPKQLARILRFQATYSALSEPPDWIDVALAHGYADQPHLIREFRSLAGNSPTQLLQHAGELTRFFTEAYRRKALT
jgi:AraC-like DNA-binding protein